MLSFYLKVMGPFSSQVSLAQNTMASICVRTSENVSLSETETTDQIQHTTGLNQRFQWEYMRYINVISFSDCFMSWIVCLNCPCTDSMQTPK